MSLFSLFMQALLRSYSGLPEAVRERMSLCADEWASPAGGRDRGREDSHCQLPGWNNRWGLWNLCFWHLQCAVCTSILVCSQNERSLSGYKIYIKHHTSNLSVLQLCVGKLSVEKVATALQLCCLEMACICMYMLRTDCKLDQFLNGPPVYKPTV